MRRSEGCSCWEPTHAGTGKDPGSSAVTGKRGMEAVPRMRAASYAKTPAWYDNTLRMLELHIGLCFYINLIYFVFFMSSLCHRPPRGPRGGSLPIVVSLTNSFIFPSPISTPCDRMSTESSPTSSFLVLAPPSLDADLS